MGSALETALEHHRAGRLREAIAGYREILASSPDDKHALLSLALAYRGAGQFDDAVIALRRLIALAPNDAEAFNQLGINLSQLGKEEESILAFRQAVLLRPGHAETYSNFSLALRLSGRTAGAIASARRSIELDGNSHYAHLNLANAFKDAGQLDEAIVSFERALALQPQELVAHSNLLYTLLFRGGTDAKTIRDAHRRWNQQHAARLGQNIEAHQNDRSPGRRLRIGYVSPDLRAHVVGRNLLPLLREDDRSRFEIFCYAAVARPDSLTETLRSHADVWRDIAHLDDEQAAKLVRDDRIDILVDLTLHMAGNRLLLFARKPAPVQVTYLGYCGTTGLGTMDYRLSDVFLDPPDADLTGYTEETIRLPQSYWCYEPRGGAPDASAVPALSAGHVCFGCLNNFCKASPAAQDLWGRLLAAVPGSRLLMHANPGPHLEPVLERLGRAGVAADRIEFVPKQSWTGYVATYQRIDIALDPFPYNGGITTCDALWMGVPVVSLIGDLAVRRAGYSILSNMGLSDLAAASPEEYLRTAADLARDLPRLQSLRGTLRQRMIASPLMDANRFARDVENVYRRMWEAWCAGGASGLAAEDFG